MGGAACCLERASVCSGGRMSLILDLESHLRNPNQNSIILRAVDDVKFIKM